MNTCLNMNVDMVESKKPNVAKARTHDKTVGCILGK